MGGRVYQGTLAKSGDTFACPNVVEGGREAAGL